MPSKRDLDSDEMDTLRRFRNPFTVLTATGEVQMNEDVQVFCSRLRSVRYSAITRYNASGSIALKNTDIHLSGKSEKLHDWPIMGSQLLVQWTTSYFLSYQDCHLFQQQFCLQHRDHRITKIFQKFWTIVRSSHNSR